MASVISYKSLTADAKCPGLERKTNVSTFCNDTHLANYLSYFVFYYCVHTCKLEFTLIVYVRVGAQKSVEQSATKSVDGIMYSNITWGTLHLQCSNVKHETRQQMADFIQFLFWAQSQ